MIITAITEPRGGTPLTALAVGTAYQITNMDPSRYVEIFNNGALEIRLSPLPKDNAVIEIEPEAGDNLVAYVRAVTDCEQAQLKVAEAV